MSQAVCTNRKATSQDKEGNAVISFIMNYLSKLSQATTEVNEPPCKLRSVKTEWIWNKSYQDLFEGAKSLVRKDR